MTYAARTDVPVSRSREEIERTLVRYGADQFAYGFNDRKAAVQFRARGRVIRFVLPLHHDGAAVTEKMREQTQRSRWRALLLSIKAKLETAESGISSFEEEFLAHIVFPNGQTAAQMALPAIAKSYDRGSVPDVGVQPVSAVCPLPLKRGYKSAKRAREAAAVGGSGGWSNDTSSR